MSCSCYVLKNTRWVLFYAVSFALVWVAETKAGSEDTEYWQAVIQRGERIVAEMSLDNEAEEERVVRLIAKQYVDLRAIHDKRDDALAVNSTHEDALEEARLQLFELHYSFLAKLSAELDQAQVEQVKDGMTYGVVPKTYRRYMELLPDLEPEHKRWIYSTLVEAREYAMDEGSSEEKHRRFGKYKGRINNYLSALGINLKEAERALAAREGAVR